MSVQITLTFPTIAEAYDALSKLATVHLPLELSSTIALADRPDVGAPLPPAVPLPPAAPPATPDLAAVFGQQTPNPSLPAPPPAQAMPAMPPVPPAPPVPPGTVAESPRDKDGLPWDSRIHAETKGTNKDGTWRAKRNIDPQFKLKIEAELRAAMGLPSPASAPSTAVAAAPPTAPAATLAGLPPPATGAALPAPPPASSAAAPSEPAAPPSPVGNGEFVKFMARVAPLFTSDPAATQTRMKAALEANGLTALGQLSHRSDLIPAVEATFAMTPA